MHPREPLKGKILPIRNIEFAIDFKIVVRNLRETPIRKKIYG